MPNDPKQFWNTPASCIVVPRWVAQSPGLLSEVREQWKRTRPALHLEAASHRDVFSVDATRSAFSIVAAACQAISAMANLLSPSPDRDRPHRVPVWEIDRASGLLRRGEIATSDRPLVETTNVYEDRGSPMLEGSEGTGLRRKPLTTIPLDNPIVDNPVASTLGRPPHDALAWTTLTPAAGSTPHWNGVSTRNLTWSGHGHTLRESRAGARIEGLERVASGLQTEGFVTWAQADNLPGRKLTPDDFPPYPEPFYNEYGARFDATDPHEWIRIRSLHTGEPVWIAREYVHYAEQMRGHRWAIETSSGSATGSSSVEAATFGILELIERDTFINSWYGRVPAIPVDATDISGMSSGMMARIHLLGWKCELGLLRTPFGLPVFVAAVATPRTRGVGTGCHPNPAAAARHALAEAITYVPERHAAAVSHLDRAERIREDPYLVREIDDHALTIVTGGHPDYAELCGTGTPIKLAEASDNYCADWTSASMKGSRALLDRLLTDLGTTGVEVFVHRQTTAVERELGVETVMTVAPALTPLDFGWRLQRALISPRPAAFAASILGGDPSVLRRLPHPFS